MCNAHRLQLPAEREKLDEVLAFVDGVLLPYDVGARTRNKIHVALDELFTNVASYAYGGKTGMATIECDVEDGTMRLKICDCGAPYNPLEQPEPDVTLGLADRPIGGLGVFLAKKLMDEMHYEYCDGLNQVTMKKKLC